MINIQNKQDCTSCRACVQRCPKQCISMHEDEEGFSYPRVNLDDCIDCGLCEKVCPVIHVSEARKPADVLAAVNPNEGERLRSSSGGIFILLCRQVISRGGVVFGARFDEHWQVAHGYAETMEEAEAFLGSKYVQSNIGESYRQTEAFLKEGREVLFSGTPCQVAGLRLFLRKEYANLLCVDFICHGAPSPGVWREYLKEYVARQCDRQKYSFASPCKNDEIGVSRISFRDKEQGWQKYSFALSLSVPDRARRKNSVSRSIHLSETLHENAFMQGFLRDLYLRPSCHACPVKELRSGSDLTLGDYWGIGSVLPEADDDKGMSAVTVNTEKGRDAFAACGAEVVSHRSYEELRRLNPAIAVSARVPVNREKFFASKGKDIIWRMRHYSRRPLRQRMSARVRGFLSMLLGRKGKDIVKRLLKT